MNYLVTSFKQRLLLNLCCCLLLITTAALSVEHANAQRVVEVPFTATFGELNDAIRGDTLADGSRVDPNTIYELPLNSRYVLNGRLRHDWDGHLTIRAAEGEGAPPVIQPGVRSDGTSDSRTMVFENGDFTLQGLWILNQSDSGGELAVGIQIDKEGLSGTLDNCIFEIARFIGIRMNTADVSIRITNSVVRNLIRLDRPGNGKFLDPRGTNAGDIYLENNTIYNVTAELFRESGSLLNNFFLNHNTLYNVGAITRNDAAVNESRLVNGTITNNQFINISPLGDVTTNWNYQGGEIVGREDIGALFPLDSLKAEDLGIAETDRNVRITNNNIFWAQAQLDYFASIDTVQVFSILSPLAMEQMNTGEVVYGDNVEEDPGFLAAPDVQNAIDYATAYYATNCAMDPVPVGCDARTNPGQWDPLVSVAASPWPLPEDFSYATTAASYTGGTGGFPVGDLNWFPDKLAEWEALGGGTGIVVANEEFDELPDHFQLRGNFPNPFNPTTNIQFDLATPADVSVEVFDLLGRKVLTIPSQLLQAGARQNITIDASSFASGIYLYQVTAQTTNDVLIKTGKMVLLK